MNNVEHRYRYDGTFNRIVDQLRNLLSSYHITPSELREACILAATMHEYDNIRPLLVRKNDTSRDWVLWEWRGDKVKLKPVDDPLPPMGSPKPFNEHVFGVEQGSEPYKFRVCKRCGLSNVYLQGNTDGCVGVLKLR